MNKKLLLSFALAAAMAGCINDADVPSGNGDNPISGAKGGNMEISFVVPNSSNGSRAASAEDSGVYESSILATRKSYWNRATMTSLP